MTVSFKQRVSIVLVIAMLVGMFCVPAISAASPLAAVTGGPTVQYYGDVDRNGTVQLRDATLVQMWLAKKPGTVLSEEQLIIADVDLSGVVQLKDVTLIQKYLAKLDCSPYPVAKEMPAGWEPTNIPTTTPATTQGSQDPTAVINGKPYYVGDQVTYSVYLKVPRKIAGIDAQIDFTGSVLTYSSHTNPVLTQLLVNTSMSNKIQFNDMNGTSGLNGFVSSEQLLISVTFTVSSAGTGTISYIIKECYDLVDDDMIKDNTNYDGSTHRATLDGNVVQITTAPITTKPVTTVPVTTKPVTTVPVTTAPVTTKPITTVPVTSTAPPQGPTAVINGTSYYVGDQVTYSVYLKVPRTIAGIDAQIDYTGAVLTYTSHSNPVLTQMLVNSGMANKVQFNDMNGTSGLAGFVTSEQLLISVTFTVSAAGTGTISYTIKECYDLSDVDLIKNNTNYHGSTHRSTLDGTPAQSTTPAGTTLPVMTTKPVTTVPVTSTAPPQGPTAVINGTSYYVGDQVTYSVYLKVPRTIAGIDAQIDYTGAVLTYASHSNPVLTQLLVNSGVANKVQFNDMNGTSGLTGFVTSEQLLISVTFTVSAAGTGTISHTIKECYDLSDVDLIKNNTNYSGSTHRSTLDGTPAVSTTTPSTTLPVTTTPLTTAPVTTRNPDTPTAVINGKAYYVGDQITYSLYLKVPRTIAGIDAQIDYPSSVLTYSSHSNPVLTQLLFNPGMTNRIQFNDMNGTSGLAGFVTSEQLLISVTFTVSAAGSGTISHTIKECYDLNDVDMIKNNNISAVGAAHRADIDGNAVIPTVHPTTEQHTTLPPVSTEQPTTQPSGDTTKIYFVAGVNWILNDGAKIFAYDPDTQTSLEMTQDGATFSADIPNTWSNIQFYRCSPSTGFSTDSWNKWTNTGSRGANNQYTATENEQGSWGNNATQPTTQPPSGDTKRIYFDNSVANWSSVNFFEWSNGDTVHSMTLLSGSIYYADIPSGVSQGLFKNTNDTTSWDGQTSDVTIPSDGGNCFKADSAGTGGNKASGTWSVYTP